VITATTIALMVIAMARNVAPEMVMMAGLIVLLLAGIITTDEAFAGLSNSAVISVAALCVVAAAARETGALDLLARRVLGRPRRLVVAQLRMMVPVAAISAFINNTPIVALMVPLVSDWATRTGMHPSKLLMPLSFATILGGTCTLIGTSTNLVVVGLARDNAPEITIGMFDIAVVGIPAAVAGIGFLATIGHRLLPAAATTAGGALTNVRKYTVGMRVQADSPIAGQTVEEAGLRHLPGLFLVEIERDGEIIPAVGPDVHIRAGDLLTFAGIVESVVDLRKIRGLVPATDQVEKLIRPSPTRRMVEAVVAAHSPLVGRSVRASRFRTVYDAAIIAVHRRGERVHAKIGDIVLKAGDALLLETLPSFVEQHRNDATFALVGEVEDSTPVRHDKAWIALSLLGAIVVLSGSGAVDLLPAAIAAAFAAVLLRCLDARQVQKAVDLGMLFTIAAAFGIATAVERTGLAALIAEGLVGLSRGWGDVGVLASIYVITAALTNIISNAAAAGLMDPIVSATAASAGMDLEPCLYLLMLGASAAFATPIGYQTSLMVLGPGRYRFGDFVRVGMPLQLVVGATSVAAAWIAWM
jgi:di/tricarboxylate transporter